ncbi:hypothetical protein MIMGU_mgv1a004797mg [Erythranthe guttata]|uniref:CUE domain-containing protein n=1 Tax=Erythranthe guttata TaxID=4155 RepID=A0A022S1G2_ERYGU|nr:hypothetical protein MIMGU_mgv1a004797mg [Erythranthe guttata]
MGFTEVHTKLVELFPVIDVRILKAVAMEHHKDADAAAAVVLEEIIPYLDENLTCNFGIPFESFYDVDDESAYDVHREQGVTCGLTLSEVSLENRIKMSGSVHSQGEPTVFIGMEGVNILQPEGSGDSVTGAANSGDKCTAVDEENNVEKSCEDGNSPVNETASLSVHDGTENSVQLVQLVQLPDVNESNLEKLDVGLSSDTVGIEDESNLTASISKSNQFNTTAVVEQSIADAGNNKQKMFSAMESVVSLMKQVELKEQDAEKAKEEAAMGGVKIQEKVEEFKEMLERAQEGNAMHAGEIYGEKAILATELKELQSRVLSLSDERDKYLAVLDGMHQTLQLRLAAAENEIRSLEQIKQEKEKLALKSLADQELIMEKVVQESQILKDQAVANAKLQKFLQDRGDVVDMLQGEIAVICQDVRLLKEKFDARVPFSQSISSNQTSFILASSSSSSKILIPDQEESVPVAVVDNYLETEHKNDHEQVNEQEESARFDRKALVDDGWEIFDKSY